MPKQSFIKGSAVLILAGAIVKVLGFVNKMVIVRIIGEEGLGLFTMAFPTLILTVTLTQLGLPVAISKMVSEAEALDDREKIRRILAVSLFTTGVLSIAFTALLICLTPLLAEYVFTDRRIMYPLLAISPIVPIVALSSVLRGYFQGRQNMNPFAFSQIIEQLLRIVFSAILAIALMPYGIGFAAAGAIGANVLGELGSLLYMFTMFKKYKKIRIRRKFWHEVRKGRKTFHDLMRVALPATGSRLIGSISYFLEPMIIVQCLAAAGISTEIATKQYGELEGLALPFLLLPTFITFSLSVSLVPVIGEATARKQTKTIHNRLNLTLKIAMITGGLSVVVSYIFAEPLMKIMYGSADAAIYVKLMAPFFFIFFFQGPLQAALQALDHSKEAMFHTILGAALKIAFIFILATRPEFGMIGVAIAMMMNVILVTVLHFASVVKFTGFTLKISDYVKGLFCIAVTAWFAYILQKYALLSIDPLLKTSLSLCVIFISYLILIGSVGLITDREMAQIPMIGKWRSKWLK